MPHSPPETPPSPPIPAPTAPCSPPSPPPTLQVISYYKDKVVSIKADRPQDEVAKQVEKAVA